MVKPYVEFNTQVRTEAEKNDDKDGRALSDETMENMRNRIDVRLVSNKKYYLNWTSKARCIS